MEIINLSGDSNVLKITDIRAAARDENRVNIFVNDDFSFSLEISQVVDLKLKIGREITKNELAEFKQASEFGKLYGRTLEWVLTRPHSEKETRDYLKRKILKRKADNNLRANNREKAKKLREAGDKEALKKLRDYKTPMKELPEIDESLTEKVLSRLIERGYIDDQKFAEYYVENRFVKKGVSTRRLKNELIAKGIKKEVIEEVISSSDRTESSEIQKLILKKRQKYNDEKLLSYLVRQGFPYDLAKSAIEEFDENNT